MFFRKRKLDDFSAEIDAHLEHEIVRLREQGLSDEEARTIARREFGNVTRARETFYESHRWLWLDHLGQDIRYGLRMLAKSPAFTAVAVVTLAIGIGANTAIFSAVNGILLRRLPYVDASRLIDIVRMKTSGNSGEQLGLITPLPSAIAYDIQAQCSAFDGLTTYIFGQPYTLTDGGGPQLLSGTAVAGNFFTVYGVRPLVGRPILPSDTVAGNSDVVELSYDVWKELFGGDPQWVGKKITLSHKQYTVIGVMPLKFDEGIGPRNGVWLPLVSGPGDATDRASGWLDVVARMKTGTTIVAAQAELNTLAARLAAAYPKTDGGWTLVAKGLNDQTDPNIKEGLLLLLGASGFVLLIACVNVSGLLLARGWDRQREVAIREALGATRSRIIRQFLSESALLALGGGSMGLLLSVWAIRVLRLLAAPYTSNVDDVKLDSPVLWFSLGAALLAGILFGLTPALQAGFRRVGPPQKERPGGTLAGYFGRRPRKLRGALVVFEVALAVTLVIGATLVALSFGKLTWVNLGFRTDHILTLRANFSTPVCDPSSKNAATQCDLAVKDVLSNLKSLHGVEGAAVASSPPARGAIVGMDLGIEGQSQKIGFSAGSPIFSRVVSAEYFDAIGMRMLQGRSFSDADVMDAERVAIVNESFAKKFLSGQPLGRRISDQNDKQGHPEWMTVVGEVNDSHDWSVDAKAFPELYIPYGQDEENTPASPILIVRTAADPMAMVAAVKQQIWSVDKDAPITDLATLERIVSDNVAQPRFQAVLLGSFGGIGLILALVGIYGVISYTVTQRTHEFGIRMALGAQPGNTLRMVIREGMLLVAVGIALGTGGALALGRILQSLLFETKPTDPATFAGVAIALAAASLAACWIPARRAMRVDPMVALRHE